MRRSSSVQLIVVRGVVIGILMLWGAAIDNDSDEVTPPVEVDITVTVNVPPTTVEPSPVLDYLSGPGG